MSQFRKPSSKEYLIETESTDAMRRPLAWLKNQCRVTSGEQIFEILPGQHILNPRSVLGLDNILRVYTKPIH